ncbi:oleate hydratase [Stenotrophomonas sp. NPDC077659]|uniref:oleate hydratase n=1 Tax=Stenotrophomonas sp. NPDC077659 TaxID=3390694 RepID=UPI003D044229
MYRSNGNFEAYSRPPKPEGVGDRRAYFVGSGLASLAGALFLIRDAQMPGSAITIFEELDIPGGSMDGILDRDKGFIIRGGREMEAHFETLWDLFRSVPSLDTPDASVLDEMYWLHKRDPSSNPCRAIHKRGSVLPEVTDLTLTTKSIEELVALALTREEDLDDKRIDEVFSDEFFSSNFWLYWATMFAFEPWASATEMRRYIMRFVHHISTLSDLTSLRFTHYNQYESLILPLVSHLKSQGVTFRYGVIVEDVLMSASVGKKHATQIQLHSRDQDERIDVGPKDLVFITNGSITESSTYGDNDTPAPVITDRGGAWSLWKRMAARDRSFGRPETFCENIPEANWTISATVTLLDDRIAPYIERLTGRDPHSGAIITGGPCSIQDSNWLYGFTMSRQPHFASQDAEKGGLNLQAQHVS